ncbi:MAG: hypothetical protein EOS68_31395, partial [Mesorhizobium sp.]
MSYGLAVSPRYKTATLDAGDTIVDLGSPDPFPVIAATDVKVFRTRAGARTQLVLDVDYAVSLLNQLPGARVTLAAGALQDDVIEVIGARPVTRPSDMNDGQKFSEEVLNSEFDSQTIFMQEARRDIDRTVTSPLGEAGLEMPVYAAGKALAWDSVERKLINAPYAPGDIASAVIATAADRVQTGLDRTQTGLDRGATAADRVATGADRLATAADRLVTAADVVSSAQNVVAAQAARDASLYGKGIFPTTAAAIGLGVVGHGAITPGATGTDGTFDLAFTGGTGSGAAGRFVVAGGVLTQILITAPGSYTVAPAFSFAASAGLAGAAAAVVLGTNVAVGEYFWTEVSTGVLGLYNVSAGPAATDTGIRAATSALLSSIDTIAMLEGLSMPTAKLTEAAGSVSPSVYRSYSFVAGDTIEHIVIAKA